MNRRVKIFLAIATLLVGGAAWFYYFELAPGPKLERTARALVGQPEAEVVKALGQPQHVVLRSTLDGKTVDYPWRGMNFVPVPDHPVRNKVLLYSKLNTAVYVYLDERGSVGYVATPGT